MLMADAWWLTWSCRAQKDESRDVVDLKSLFGFFIFDQAMKVLALFYSLS